MWTVHFCSSLRRGARTSRYPHKWKLNITLQVPTSTLVVQNCCVVWQHLKCATHPFLVISDDGKILLDPKYKFSRKPAAQNYCGVSCISLHITKNNFISSLLVPQWKWTWPWAVNTQFDEVMHELDTPTLSILLLQGWERHRCYDRRHK